MTEKDPSIAMKPEWIRAITKAASSLRFTAYAWEWMTPEAQRESCDIADLLSEIEVEYVRQKKCTD